MPFQPRDKQPGLADALYWVTTHDRDLREWDARRRELIDQRAEAIRHAISLGATLKEIGELLGVSAVRAGQMRDGV